MALTTTYLAQPVTTQFTVDNNYSSYATDVLALSGGGFVSAFDGLDNTFVYTPILNFYNADYSLAASYRIPASGATDGVGTQVAQLVGSNNVVVIWDENNASNPGIKAAIYDQTGNLVKAEFDVSTNDTRHDHVSVTALTNGEFVVCGSFTGGGITFRRYDSSGNLVGSFLNPVDATAGNTGVQVQALLGGGFAVSWYNTGSDTVRGRIYDQTGAATTAAFDLGSGPTDSTSITGLTAFGSGFAVAYHDTQWNGDGISLRFWSSGGANLTPGGVIRVDQSDGFADQAPNLSISSDGYILVSWNRGLNDIYGRVFDPNGLALTNEFMISDAGGSDGGAKLSSFGDGRYVVTWSTNPDPQNEPFSNSVVGKVIELTRTVVGDLAADSYVSTDRLRDSLSGGGGSDSLNGGMGSDTLVGGAAGDLLEGGDATDTILGGFGNDRMYSATLAAPDASAAGDSIGGESGNDLAVGSAGADTIDGGDGDDRLFGRGGEDLIAGALGEDVIQGLDGADTLSGGLDGDTIYGGLDNDLIYGMDAATPDGSSLADLIFAGSGDDTVYGSGGADTIRAEAGNDTVLGGSGADLVIDTAGNDLFRGEGGADDLRGANGADSLVGGAGADTLNGGASNDRYVYELTSDSTVAAPDLIVALIAGDRIDLSAIDANVFEGGDQKFKLAAAFTGVAGQLVVTYHTSGAYSGMTSFAGDVNADGTADLFLLANGDHSGWTGFIF
jgi:hypothetical protein